MVPRADLDVLEKIKVLSLPGQEPRIVQSVASIIQCILLQYVFIIVLGKQHKDTNTTQIHNSINEVLGQKLSMPETLFS